MYLSFITPASLSAVRFSPQTLTSSTSFCNNVLQPWSIPARSSTPSTSIVANPSSRSLCRAPPRASMALSTSPKQSQEHQISKQVTAAASHFSSSTSALRLDDYLRIFARAVPNLDRPDLYKGATARIAIVGGSAEYTGAPYFAAMAALRAGGELAHVFCAESAAGPIKSYSPELIVHPNFNGLEISLSRMHAVVLGPGIGRSDQARSIVRTVLALATHHGTPWPLIIDADALWFLAQESSSELRDMLRTPLANDDAPRVFLTPNAVELTRLCNAVGASNALELAAWFRGDASSYGRVICVAKGPYDVVASAGSDGEDPMQVSINVTGGKKRCGGQGDVLAGLLAVSAGWSSSYISSSESDVIISGSTLNIDAEMISVAAAVTSCVAARIASARAFQENGRSMLATHMMDHVAHGLELATSRLSVDYS